MKAGSLEGHLGLSEWTSDNDGIGGILKSRVEDFRVEEISKIPALDPKGRFTVARITLVNWETNRFLKTFCMQKHKMEETFKLLRVKKEKKSYFEMPVPNMVNYIFN